MEATPHLRILLNIASPLGDQQAGDQPHQLVQEQVCGSQQPGGVQIRQRQHHQHTQDTADHVDGDAAGDRGLEAPCAGDCVAEGREALAGDQRSRGAVLGNASKHPKVVKGEITQEQAFDEFARNFNDRTGAGKIEKCEWDDYYAAVSASMDNDDHFIELIRSTWGLNEM